MSNLRVNNVNIGGTSVDGVIQQVDSQGTPNTAGNKITLKTDGSNTIDGNTTFVDATELKVVSNGSVSSNFSASTRLGQIVECTSSQNTTITVNSAATGNIVTFLNTGSGTVAITQDTGVTLNLVGTGAQSPVSLAQYGMATVYYTSATTAYVSGVGLS